MGGFGRGFSIVTALLALSHVMLGLHFWGAASDSSRTGLYAGHAHGRKHRAEAKAGGTLPTWDEEKTKSQASEDRSRRQGRRRFRGGGCRALVLVAAPDKIDCPQTVSQSACRQSFSRAMALHASSQRDPRLYQGAEP